MFLVMLSTLLPQEASESFAPHPPTPRCDFCPSIYEFDLISLIIGEFGPSPHAGWYLSSSSVNALHNLTQFPGGLSVFPY